MTNSKLPIALVRPTTAHTVRLNWAKNKRGYNRVTLTTPLKNYHASGGGYDMAGAVLGQYLSDLLTAEQIQTAIAKGAIAISENDDGAYHINGAVGQSTLFRIAKSVGWKIDQRYRGNKHVGFTLEPLAPDA